MQNFNMFKELKNIHVIEIFGKGKMEQDVVGGERTKVYRALSDKLRNLDFIISLIENEF